MKAHEKELLAFNEKNTDNGEEEDAKKENKDNR